MRTLRIAGLALAAAWASVCGNPTRPSETVSGLAITGPDVTLTGLTATYVATVTFEDGTTRTAAATWASSHPQVATVDSGGRIEGRAHGSTVLTASFAGQQASKAVQVVNNYSGSWSGRYVARACTKTGQHDRDGGCRGVVGSESLVTLRLTQTGATLREIGGTMDLGGSAGAFGVPVRGLVTDDGRLNLDGRFELSDCYGYGICCVLEIAGWDTRLSDTDAMSGGWTQRFTFIGFSGNSYVESEIVTLVRLGARITP